jgi:hypothetical protein
MAPLVNEDPGYERCVTTRRVVGPESLQAMSLEKGATVLLILDQPARETCPACRSNVEKGGWFLIDSANVRQFRCDRHTRELMPFVMQPLKNVTVEM